MHVRAFFFPLLVMITACLSLPSTSVADLPPETLFQQGLAAFQKSDFKQARAHFQQAAQSSENPLLLYNLGLTEYRLGYPGMALALWRKALATDAGFSTAARAITWAHDKLERSEIPHEVELWETLRTHTLVRVSLSTYLLACALSLATAGWLILRYLGLRRLARLDEKPMPAFPSAAVFTTITFFAFAFFATAKIYDDSVERGTILEKKVAALSSPAADATPLFDLYEGLEVLVRSRSESWVQVTYPGGSTGWIPNTAILAINDKVVR